MWGKKISLEEENYFCILSPVWFFLMSTPDNLPTCPATLHRPITLDLNGSSSSTKKMCYHSDMTISYCCGTVDNNVNTNLGARLTNQDVMTYGHFMRGSIFSVPKLWQVDNGESLVVSVYSYLKTFLRWEYFQTMKSDFLKIVLTFLKLKKMALWEITTHIHEVL